MGIASITVTAQQAATAKIAARVQSNARLNATLLASQAAIFREFWADPINMAAAYGTDMQAAFSVFQTINNALLQIWLHDNLVVASGLNGAPSTRSLSKALNIPGLVLTAGADPTLAASYTACYALGWTIAWNSDGGGTPAKAS